MTPIAETRYRQVGGLEICVITQFRGLDLSHREAPDPHLWDTVVSHGACGGTSYPSRQAALDGHLLTCTRVEADLLARGGFAGKATVYA